MGRAISYEQTPHNRLWLAIAHAMGHTGLKVFGKEEFCAEGPLVLT
jgi:hypothetical protein